MKKCPVSTYCGGCQYQGLPYTEQLKKKQEESEKLLSSFCHVEKIIGMDDRDHYRNKVQMNFAYDEHRNIISGYYVASTHTIVPVEECGLCDEMISRIMSSVKKIIIRKRIPIYDERSARGCLRCVMIRSTNTGEYVVVLVSKTADFAHREEVVRDIIHFNPEVKTVVQNINSSRSSAVLGKRNIVLYGKGYITDELCGLKFRISPSSFYQVNRRQTEILYREAIKATGLNDSKILLDVYCGTGTIGLCAAGSAKKIIGVESNSSAVKDAKINMKINDIENAEFVCEDAGKYMEFLARNKTHIDVVIMDPPRKGADQRFMSSMVKMRPDRIVYVSCNQLTLKENLKFLSRYYEVTSIQPVDMFPYTSHVETIVLMSRM